MVISFFHFQETYNSRLRERYGDDFSTHSDFDPDLWMEVGSSGGLDKNRVYKLSNTTIKNLWAASSISTVGSSQSISSTHFKEFVAWQHTAHITEKYEQLSANYEQLHPMVMNITSQSGDTCAASFWPYGPGNNQPLPPPPPPTPPLF
jgi:hypothetical protein